MPILSLLAMWAVPLAGAFGSGYLLNRKNYRGRALAARVLVSVAFPLLGVGLAALAPKRPEIGTTREQQDAFDKEFEIGKMKDALEKRQARQDRLEMFRERSTAFRLVHPGLWFPETRMRNNARLIEDGKHDIRLEYEMLGRLQRRAEMSGDDRFVSIRMETGPDGTPVRFGLPYDMRKDQQNEVRMLIARQYGVDPADPTVFYQSPHRGAAMDGVDMCHTLLVYDSREGSVSAFGKELSEAAVKRVAGIAEDLRKKLEKEGLGEVRNCLTVDTAGRDSVTLNMNGVTLAYVVAGEDGKIRSMGNGIAPGDRQGLKLASALHESLKGCMTVDDWIGKASRICLSPGNIAAAREGEVREKSARKRLDQKKKTRLGIMDAPKKSVRSMHDGVKV